VPRRTALWLTLLGALSLAFEWGGRVARLEAELASGDPARRREVVRLLAAHAVDAVRAPLLQALGDPDATVRLEAADVAGRLQIRESTATLVTWIDDPDVAAREAAARALGRLGDTGQRGPLVRALGDPDARVRRAAVGAVAALGGAESVVPLLGRLDDDDPQVRVDAAVALGALGDARATVPLVGRARDGAPEVRAAVYTALGALGDARGLAPLAQGLRDEQEDARLAAIAALGRLDADAAVDALVERLEGEAPRARRAIVAALGARGDASAAGSRAITATVEALADPDAVGIAGEALLSLVRRGRPEERRLVVAALADGLDRGLAPGALARLLERLADDVPLDAAVPALTRALDGLHAAAARLPPGALAREPLRATEAPLLRALARSGGEGVLVRLLEALQADDALRHETTLAALTLYYDHAPPDGRAADPLLDALGRVPRGLRPDVVALLGRVGARRAVPALVPLLSSDAPSLRLAAARALGTLGDPEGAARLATLLDDRDARVRFEAAVALGPSADPVLLATLAARLTARAPADRPALTLALGGMLATHREAGRPAGERAAALHALLRAARSDDARLDARALDALSIAADPSTIPELLALAAAPDVARRSAAVRALAVFDDARALDALRALADDPAPAVALAALTSLGEHGKRGDADRLFDGASRARWPLSAGATFALARLARRGVLADDPRAAERLCALFASRDVYVRANAATALAALGAGRCAQPSLAPHALLGPAHGEALRIAAAHWARSALAASPAAAAESTAALDACAARDPSPDVARACAISALPPLDGVADVVAYVGPGRTSRPGALVALRFADGSALLAHLDANARVRLAPAPRGPITLEDPLAVPLEPPLAPR
jgi:HEAT repeat protein